MRALLALAVLLPAVAAADVTAKARGSAGVTGGDTAAARARALDDAARQAVDQTVTGLLDPRAREAGNDVIKKRILRRARAYVREFKVVSEGADDGVYAVEIDATVNDGQLTADLRALGVGAPPPAVGEPVPDDTPPPRVRPPLALLLVTHSGDRADATFGRQGTDGGPAAAALLRELGARGFKVARTAGLDVPVAPGAEGGGVPLDVAQASALARAAGAGGALVGAAELKDGGRIRGTALVGAECQMTLRVDDVGAGRIAEARVDGAGFGPDAPAAASAAARDAATRAGRELGRRLDGHWPEETAAPAGHGALVRVRGALRWADIEAFARALGAVPGVRQVVVARFARREVALVVTGGASTRALADAAGQVALADVRVAARAAPGEVAVDLSADTSRPVPAPGDR